MVDIVLSQQDVEQVRQALLAGLETASGARSKATSLHSARQQIEATRAQVAKVRDVSRELPLLISIQSGVTGFFIREAVLLELQSTTRRGRNRIIAPDEWIDEALCDKALYKSLYNLETTAGVPHLLRTMVETRARGINNARARRVFLTYLLNHRRLEFWAVKYKSKLSTALRHLWGKRNTDIIMNITTQIMSELNYVAPGEGVALSKTSRYMLNRHILRYTAGSTRTNRAINTVLAYIFDVEIDWPMYDDGPHATPMIRQALLARQDIFDKPLVPEEVLTGMVSRPSHPQHAEHWSTKELQAKTLETLRKTSKVETAEQAVRKTHRERELGIEREDRAEIIAKVKDPIALLKTGYEDEFSDDIVSQLNKLAGDNAYKGFPYSYIGIVEDTSPSMHGHYLESKNTPRAISEFTRMVLARSAHADVVFTDNASGQSNTDLASAFLDLMSSVTSGEIEAVFVLSDGYENSYDGLLSQIVRTYRRATGHDVPVFAVSPMGFAEANMGARSLGKGITSLVADYRSLPVQLSRHLLEADIRKWIELNINALLGYLTPGTPPRVDVIPI